MSKLTDLLEEEEVETKTQSTPAKTVASQPEKSNQQVTIKIKDRNRFLSMIKKAADACSSSDNIPVLNNIKVQVKKSIPKPQPDGTVKHLKANVLFLTSGDGAHSLIMGVAKAEGSQDSLIDADQEVQFLVHGKTFAGVFSKLPAGDVTLKVGDDKLSIAAGNSKFSLTLQPVDQYTTMEPEDVTPVMLPAKEFCTALDDSAYAADKKADNALQGVHLKGTEKGLLVEAFDRGRAGMELVQLTSPLELDAILGTDTTNQLISTFKNFEGELRVFMGKTRIAVSANGITLVARLLDYNYPDTSKLVPDQFVTEASLNRGEFLAAIERASELIGNQRSHIIMELSSNEMIIKAKGELGAGTDSIPLQGLTQPHTFAADPKFLSEALKNLAPFSRIQMRVAHPLPIVFNPLDENGQMMASRHAIVVPCRFREV